MRTNEAENYSRELPDGSRIIIYMRHSDRAGLVWKYWICHQSRNPWHGDPEFPNAGKWTVSGQRYKDKDGWWREPHGLNHVLTFRNPLAAIATADALQPDQLPHGCSELATA